jgi:sporulation protein YqfC
MRDKKDDEHKKNRMNLMERIGAKLDIPTDVFNSIHIELRGRNNLTVRGCRKILRYTTEEVRLRLHGVTLIVCGEQLYCTAYHSNTVEIDGIIDSISFCPPSGADKRS